MEMAITITIEVGIFGERTLSRPERASVRAGAAHPFGGGKSLLTYVYSRRATDRRSAPRAVTDDMRNTQ